MADPRKGKPTKKLDRNAEEAAIKEFVAKHGVTKADPPTYRPIPQHRAWRPEPHLDDLRLLAKVKESDKESDKEPGRPPKAKVESDKEPGRPLKAKVESDKKPGRPLKAKIESDKKPGHPPKAKVEAETTKRGGHRPPVNVIAQERIEQFRIDYDDVGSYTEGPWKSKTESLRVTDLSGRLTICHVDPRGRRDQDLHEETLANIDLISAAADYDAVALAFLRNYEHIDDSLLRRVIAGENVSIIARASIDAHTARAILGFRLAFKKARGAAENRQIPTKRCRECKEIKPYYEFRRGHGRCHQCHRVKSIEGRQRRRQNLIQYNRRWRVENDMLAPGFYKVKEAIEALIGEGHTQITQAMVRDRGVTVSITNTYWRHPEIIKIGGDRLYRPEDRAELIKRAIQELMSEGVRPTQHKVADRLGLPRGSIHHHWSKFGTTVEMIKMAIEQLYEAGEPITQVAVAKITRLDVKNTIPRNWKNRQIQRLLKQRLITKKRVEAGQLVS